MNKLDKLIYKELIPTVLIALVILTFIAFSKEFERFAQLLITSGTSISAFITVVLIILSNVMYVTIPIALLIGTISCFSRLSSDSEIVALKSCGINSYRLIKPVMNVAGILFIGTMLLTVYIAPAANNRLRTLQYDIALSQLTTEIQPRVFNDKFRNFIFYLDDIDHHTNTWKGIFLVENRNGSDQQIYLAQTGQLFFHPKRKFLQLHLADGLIYSVSPSDYSTDKITRFGSLDIPLKQLNIKPPSDIPKKNREKSMLELYNEIRLDPTSWRNYSDNQFERDLEFYRRIALPFACLVFALIGVPLGITSQRGGRSSGFVISLLVVFLYYTVFIYVYKAGMFYGLFPVSIGIWGANILFAVFGFLALWLSNADMHPLRRLMNRPLFSAFCCAYDRLKAHWIRVWDRFRKRSHLDRIVSAENPLRFTRVLDGYIMKEYLKILSLTVLGALTLFTIFTLFEVIDEIYANHIAWTKVVEYFLFVWPTILVVVLPLCILVSLLICFGMLEKSNQITALKASGVSVYRISAPVVAIIVLLSIGVFALQEFILPYTNQRQDNLYNQIKGRKVQTYYRPDITWIMGSNGKIYNYSYFDYDRNVFADLSVFQIDLREARLDSRYFAPRAIWEKKIDKWVLMNGWKRDFRNQDAGFTIFDTLAINFGDKPAYFKTESKRSDKMSFQELARYIRKLKSGGFDTLGLEVDLYTKISYPMVNLVMLLIGLPFSFKMGKKGALYGVAVSILIGITFWALFQVFTAMGQHDIVPPLLAAWAPNLFFGSAGFYMALNLRT